MKIPLPVIAILIGTALCGFVVSEWSEIKNGEICGKNENTQQKECTNYHALPFIFIKVTKSLDDHAGAIGAIATIFIAYFTFTLFRATDQLKLLAKESGEAFPKIERAYVFVGVEMPDGWLRFDESGAEIDLTIKFKNHGKTPAILSGLNAKLSPIEPGKYPERITDGDKNIPPALVIGAGRSHTEHIWQHIFKKEWDSVENMSLTLICYGRIYYLDVLGDSRETGFCWEFQPHEYRRCFYLSDTKKLNYYI